MFGNKNYNYHKTPSIKKTINKTKCPYCNSSDTFFYFHGYGLSCYTCKKQCHQCSKTHKLEKIVIDHCDFCRINLKHIFHSVSLKYT